MQAINPSAQSAALQQLTQYLVDDDPEAVTYYLDNQKVLDPALGEGAAAIVSALTEFRLDDALLAMLART
jgi:hypothetical protein